MHFGTLSWAQPRAFHAGARAQLLDLTTAIGAPLALGEALDAALGILTRELRVAGAPSTLGAA